ncbi:helix-turn-helix domain-containing protein [Chryseobacterium viscerum]|uniref:XRE family transcriptional regulator n=1 Tax=Chryseobacterium viscerum TaxID=1037377 RepID=A0A316WRW6_9FLAO|nr:helix-turn-helix transcriptional regulator [Chryseobacterium viscerum]PWN64184.1 XRE family transcriptional regulator [Chryseobacterium viscerum]
MESELSPIEQYVVDYVIRLRIAKDLTQADIGVIINTKGSFVSNVENIKNRSKYNLDHINALADHFDLSPGDFLPKKALPVKDSNKE